MREMKGSGVKSIGEIPACWCTRKFKTLAKLCNGREVGSDEGTIPVYGSGGIFKYTDKPLYSGESLLLGRKGTIDNPMIVDGEFWTVDTMFYTSAFQNVLGKYMYYCFKGTVDYGFYKSGSVLPSMTQTEINGISLPYPPLPEQRRIADHLDVACSKVDALIANQQAQIEKLKAYKQSLITEVVTRGLNHDAPMKDSGVEWIGMIPEGWKVVQLGSISNSMRNGYVGPTRDLFVDEGERYIQSLHIKDGSIDFSKHEYYVTKQWGDLHPKVKTGNLLIVQTGDIGQVGVVTPEYNDCNCHALIIVDVNAERCLPEYLSLYFQSKTGKELLLATKTGALLPHLNSGRITSAKVTLPPINTQKAIVSYLSEKLATVNRLIAIKQQKIEKLTEYKKSLIYEYVTGKKEVI